MADRGVSLEPIWFATTVFFLTAILTGCETDGPKGTRLLGDLPILTVEEVTRIGHLNDPEVGFSRLGEVDVDRDGNDRR